MFAKTLPALLALALVASISLRAQSPTPVLVQAVTNPAATTTAAGESTASTLKVLQEIKAANDAVLAKQAATLQRLDELEKAAEQIKIYSKRG